jgi:phosphoglycolate phosphatase
MYTIICFDLDGTITDSASSIIASFTHALSVMGKNVENPERLKAYIGPPLENTFQKEFGFSKEETTIAIKAFRSFMQSKGTQMTTVFPGMSELLNTLSKNHLLYVVTSKATIIARETLEFHHLDSYFTDVIGMSLEYTTLTKTDLIQIAIDKNTHIPKSEIIMIGDRYHDIEGAKNCGIDSIGVLYGYGSPEEMDMCNPTYTVKNPSQIAKILII